MAKSTCVDSRLWRVREDGYGNTLDVDSRLWQVREDGLGNRLPRLLVARSLDAIQAHVSRDPCGEVGDIGGKAARGATFSQPDLERGVDRLARLQGIEHGLFLRPNSAAGGSVGSDSNSGDRAIA